MKTAEVVYVPIPQTAAEEEQDLAVQKTFQMLLREGFQKSGQLTIKDWRNTEYAVRVFHKPLQ